MRAVKGSGPRAGRHGAGTVGGVDLLSRSVVQAALGTFRVLRSVDDGQPLRPEPGEDAAPQAATATVPRR
jgi:hypothetical protein